jgi:uncharacterized RDD family membrane protein YckC
MSTAHAPAISVPLSQASLRRRVASLFYEALLLGAVLWCATLPLAALQSSLSHAPARALYQFYLAVIAGIYFIWQWTRGGQTLAMKTWHLRLVARDGAAITLRQAALRYLIALVGLACFGAGFLWALVDRDHTFLHDRIAGTRLMRIA